MRFFLSAIVFTSIMGGLFAQNEIVDSSTRETFPREISFEANGKNYQLEATGVATRKKLIVKVYSVAHYLQKGVAQPNTDIFEVIMSDDNAKQITMKWVRDVGADKVLETFQEAFRKAFPGEQYGKMLGVINQFLPFFSQGAHKGDEFDLRWLPAGYVEVLINGKKIGNVTNKEFAQGLWSIWLGPGSIVNRNDLVSLVH